MIPLIDSTKTTGLIFFPGTMVGMLLAGAAPIDAVRLQLVLLYVLLGSVALGALSATLLAYRNFFTTAHQLHEPAADHRASVSALLRAWECAPAAFEREPHRPLHHRRG